MPKIGLIALDLDGTLLTSSKELAEKDRQALTQAAEAGIEIVPTTGRFYMAMPEQIRSLPFIHYAITMNGAQVLDTRSGTTIAKAEIPNATALRLMRYLDERPVIYDCYKNGGAYMTAAMKERAGEFISDEHFLSMVRSLRVPVEDLKTFVREQGGDLQKMIAFFRDPAYRPILLRELQAQFPELSITSSVPANLEINSIDANKGNALLSLAEQLGIPREGTMSFGDGLNDLSMIRSAGIGVAMANATPEVLEAADHVTLDNDSCGVAAAIYHFIEL